MRKKTNGTGLLVIMELGASWPELAATVSTGPLLEQARRVLTQLEGETPAELCERVASDLDQLFGRGIKLSSVAIACNERTDAAADAARRKLSGLLLGLMAKHRDGALYLTASERSGGRLRHALSALAQGLFQEWSSAGLAVSVEFGH